MFRTFLKKVLNAVKAGNKPAAEAAYKAARDAVAIFGKSPADMDRIVEQRHIDPILTVVSPIAGRITARSAQPGLLLQPGNGTAPFTVSDISTMWMQAFVPEADSPPAEPYRMFTAPPCSSVDVPTSSHETPTARSPWTGT